MIIFISILELTDEVRKLYLENKIHSIHIDYAPSCLMGWIGEKDKMTEIVVYDFSRFAQLVNKHKNYTIYTDTVNIIIKIDN